MIECYDCLFDFFNHYEGTKLEHSKEHGYHITFDMKRGKFIRSGSVLTGAGHGITTENDVGRINGHIKE